MTAPDLCDFELRVLSKLSEHDPLDFGAALSAALETLRARGLIDARLKPTEAGLNRLAQIPVSSRAFAERKPGTGEGSGVRVSQ